MPGKCGYPFKELYTGSKNLFGNGKYAREGHYCFRIRRVVAVFEKKAYAYVFWTRTTPHTASENG